MNVKILSLSLALCAAATVFGCKKNDGGNELPPPEPAIDFSMLTAENHPRLLMSAADFDDLKSKLAGGSQPHLQKLHDAVKAVYNTEVANGASQPVVYQLDAADKRLLTISNRALKRIFSSAYLYRMTGEQKYLTYAEGLINTVCDFPDWNAVKHFLDVGEMAAGVGIGYDWLYHELQPATKAKVVDKLNKYAFQPVIDNTPQHSFYVMENNWNQVCIGGLLCGALAIYEDLPGVAGGMIEDGIKYNMKAMKAIYSPDGNYPEGYGYWGYGTAFQTLIIAAAETALGDDQGLSDVPGFAASAEYMLFMEGVDRKVFNYSDCAQGAKALLSTWWFARKNNDPRLLYNEIKELDAGRYPSNEYARLLPMFISFAKDVQATGEIAPPSKKIWSGNGTTPVVLIRTGWNDPANDKYLAVKGGQANTSHGHMDAGTFVYDALGVRWSKDLGLQSYTTLETDSYIGGALWNMGQDSKRWEVFRLNNKNHSTLTINESRHAVNGKAEVTGIIDTPSEMGATLNLTPALRSDIAEAIRTVKIVGNRDLVVEDKVRALMSKTAKIRWSMVTEAEAVIENGGITLSLPKPDGGGAKVKMRLTAATLNGTPVEYKYWSANQSETNSDGTPSELQSFDQNNTNTRIVGFETTGVLHFGASETFTVTLSPVD